MKIGIFDPAFDFLGHYSFFNRYIASLVDTSENQVYFLDVGGKMRKSYGEDLVLQRPPIFISLAEEPHVTVPIRPQSLVSFAWWKNRIGEYSWYKKIFSKIADLGLDVVIFSSMENVPVMYFVPTKFPYIALVLYPASLFKTRASLTGYRKILWPLYTLYIQGFYKFLKRAKLIFTTNEPSIPTPELARFSVSWLPNRSFGDAPQEETRTMAPERPITFLTIGTVSNFKNHLFAIDAFEKYALPFSYVIAGAPVDATGDLVMRRVRETKNNMIAGIFKKLDEQEYATLIEKANFMLLPYDFKRGAISSQVMHDAFSKSIPIIAPDVQPFTFYIERYGVGLLYKEGDEHSFIGALEKAAKMRREDFREHFIMLHDNLSFLKVKKEFLEKIT